MLYEPKYVYINGDDQCISFDQNSSFNLDLSLLEYMSKNNYYNQQTITAFTQALKTSKNRIKYLKEQNYIDLLAGKTFSYQQLKDICKQHTTGLFKTIDSCLKELDLQELKNVYVPERYRENITF